MGLELIVGAADAATTAELYRRYRATLEAGGDAYLVVPNRLAQHQAEQTLAGRAALVGGSILTFDTLFGRIVESAATPVTRLLSPARRRLELSRVIASASLASIERSARQARFVDSFAALIDRLGSNLTTPALFSAATADDPTTAELAGLYAAWWAHLEVAATSDAAKRRIDACRLVADNLDAWSGHAVFVQGFEDLTPAQERLVRSVGDRARAVVALPYQPGRSAFAAVSGVASRLAEAAERIDEPAHTDTRPPRLALLEQHLFETTPPVSAEPDDTAFALLEAAGTRAEADLVVSEVCDALRAGIDADRIAVVVLDERDSVATITDALDTAGVAYASLRRERLARTGFGYALERLLRFAWDDNADRTDLYAYLRSPFSGFARRRIDFVEGRLRGRGIKEREATLATTRELLTTEPEAVSILRSAGSTTAALRSACRQMASAAFGLAAHVPSREETQNIAALRATLELLDDVEDASPSRAELRAALGRVRLAAPIDIRGRVFVGDARDVRGAQLDVCILGGVDTTPRAADDDGFLPTPVRERLTPSAPEPSDVARHLAYVASTRAHRRLVVVRLVANDDGRPQPATALLTELVSAAGGAEVTGRRGLADLAFTPEQAPTTRERLRAVSRLALTDPRRAARIADQDGSTRRLRRAEHAYRRRVALRDPRVLGVLGALDRFPVTALEKFGDCSAWWFVERYLAPKDIDASYDARLAGSVAHVALQRFYRGVPAAFGKDRLEPADAERAAALIAQHVEDAVRSQTLPSDTLEARVMTRRLIRDLSRFVRQDAATPSPLAPTRLEVSFGGASAAPGLKDGLAIDDFFVSGKIDRIDTDPAFSAHALVTDYKSGRTAHSAVEMIREGRLQIPLYLLAARDLLGLEPIGGLYRALGLGGQTRGAVRTDADGVPPGVLDPDRVSPEALWAIVEDAKASASTAVTRIRRGDLRHDPRGGECPPYCPWSGVCRIPR